MYQHDLCVFKAGRLGMCDKFDLWILTHSGTRWLVPFWIAARVIFDCER